MKAAVIVFMVGAFLMGALLAPALYHADKEIQALVLENKALQGDIDRAEGDLQRVCSYMSVDTLDSYDLTECQ